MLKRLTQRQAQILNFCIAYLLREHTTASVREIGAAMGIRSTNGITDHVRAIARKGYVTRRPYSQHLTILHHPDGRPFLLRCD